MSLPRIEILTTGGTIAGRGDSATGSAYHAGEVSGNDLVSAVPGLSEIADITVREIASIPSQDMNEAVWKELLTALYEDEEKFDGFVITHGTDTMEETAFFLALTAPEAKSVVLTGAMLPSTAVSADGPRNLFNAVSAAIAPEAADYGVLIAMNGELFAAPGVFKSKTVALETFASRISGPCGWVQNGEAHFTVPAAPAVRMTADLISRLLASPELPKTAIVPTWAGADGTAAAAYLTAGFRGLVIEGMGDGNIPAAMIAVLREAAANGVAVVRSSRCAYGPVLEAGETDDEAEGFVCGGALSPAQCRTLLSLALLADDSDRTDLQMIFSSF